MLCDLNFDTESEWLNGKKPKVVILMDWVAGCGSLCTVRKSWLKWLWSEVAAHTDLPLPHRPRTFWTFTPSLFIMSWIYRWKDENHRRGKLVAVIDPAQCVTLPGKLWLWLHFSLTQPASDVLNSEQKGKEFGFLFFAFFPSRTPVGLQALNFFKETDWISRTQHLFWNPLLTTSWKNPCSPDDLLCHWRETSCKVVPAAEVKFPHCSVNCSNLLWSLT